MRISNWQWEFGIGWSTQFETVTGATEGSFRSVSASPQKFPDIS
jgi:hypothetical protein